MPANRRWDAKRDKSEPAIVDALRAAGCWVYRELPVDLLIRVPTDPPGMLRCAEVKTPTATGKRPSRKQQKQMEFIQVTGTPYVLTPEAALKVITGQWICPACHLRQDGIKIDGGF